MEDVAAVVLAADEAVIRQEAVAVLVFPVVEAVILPAANQARLLVIHRAEKAILPEVLIVPVAF